MVTYDIIKKDGLTIELLASLSFKSKLNHSLKRTLRHFDKQALFKELQKINEWYDLNENLHDILIDYRIKSLQSAYQKYHRYPLNRPLAKVFNNLLGFRPLCDNYEDILSLSQDSNIYIVDMSKGKSNDDGYRGVHIYFQLSNYHYPIEIQYNTYYDRQLNNWLHKYVYKKNISNSIGTMLRKNMNNHTFKIKQCLRRCYLVCYLIAKDFNSTGSIALQTNHGQQLVDFKKKILSVIGYDNIQLITISRPSAYGEYEPYSFANSEKDFEKKVYAMYHKNK